MQVLAYSQKIIEKQQWKCSALVCCLDGSCSIHRQVKFTRCASEGFIHQH